MSVNKDAFEALTRHRLALLRYEAGTARELVAVYDAALADVLREMDALRAANAAGEPLDLDRLARLRRVSEELAGKVREAKRVAELDLRARLAETAEAEADFHAGRLARSIGVSFTRVPEAQVATAITSPLGGGVWTQRLAVDLFNAQDEIRGAIAQGIAQGGSVQAVADMIGATFSVSETYRNRLVAIARTEVQRVANDVALASYVENADVISGVQWLATLDSRTCLVCARRHNVVYPLENGRPVGLDRRPPLHPRCRCFLAPVVKPYAEITGETTKPPTQYDGRPAADTTFTAWLRRQPADVQTDILGEERRNLWRSGVPLDRFTDGRRPLRLGELRALAATARQTVTSHVKKSR